MAKKKRENGVPAASADEPTLVETATVVSDPPPYMLEDLGTGVEPIGEIWPGHLVGDSVTESFGEGVVVDMTNTITVETAPTTTITIAGETVVAGEVVVSGEMVGGEVLGDEDLPPDTITLGRPIPVEPNENVGVRVMRMLNQSLEAEVASLRAELEQARVVVADYEARLADVSDERARVESKRASLSMENALLNDRIEELGAQRGELLAQLRKLAAGTLFQILPKHHETQPKVTRLLVIAADATEAIRKAVDAGAVKPNDVANLTVVCEKVYL